MAVKLANVQEIMLVKSGINISLLSSFPMRQKIKEKEESGVAGCVMNQNWFEWLNYYQCDLATK